MTRYTVNDNWQDTSAYISDVMNPQITNTTPQPLLSRGETIEDLWTGLRGVNAAPDVTFEEFSRWVEENNE